MLKGNGRVASVCRTPNLHRSNDIVYPEKNGQPDTTIYQLSHRGKGSFPQHIRSVYKRSEEISGIHRGKQKKYKESEIRRHYCLLKPSQEFRQPDIYNSQKHFFTERVLPVPARRRCSGGGYDGEFQESEGVETSATCTRDGRRCYADRKTPGHKAVSPGQSHARTYLLIRTEGERDYQFKTG